MGGMEYEVSDGVGMMLDRSAFAGSTTLLGQMLPILINVVGIPLAALGLLAGYAGGWIDSVLSRIVDAMLAVPFLILAMLALLSEGLAPPNGLSRAAA